ncbi:MAG: hypothetical protein WC242_01830 [Candidatus Paceibacterota bacterium]|jgi:hypothetical protein
MTHEWMKGIRGLEVEAGAPARLWYPGTGDGIKISGKFVITFENGETLVGIWEIYSSQMYLKTSDGKRIRKDHSLISQALRIEIANRVNEVCRVSFTTMILESAINAELID